MTATDLPIRVNPCPVCAATDAFVEAVSELDEYYVECVHCGVYRASRRAFRHFEYLRSRGERDGLERLARLAGFLHARRRGETTHLEYDTWQHLIAQESP